MNATVLLVGLGQIGMGYDRALDPATHVYTHARAFSLHPRFRLVAGVDPDPARREAFAAMYGAAAYADIDAALDKHQPDVVVIAVPTRRHSSALQSALARSRPRVILCEKPLSYDVGEATRMVETCAARNSRLYVNYVRRSDPGVVEVKRRMETGELGTSFKGVVWYSKGFFHTGSHFFNLLEYWLGPMQDSMVLRQGRTWDNVDSEPDVHVSYDRGAVTFLAAWEEAFSHYTVELVSLAGRLRYEDGGRQIRWQPVAPAPGLSGHCRLSPTPDIVDSGMDRYQMNVVDHLSRALDGQHAELCSGDEALRTLRSMATIVAAHV